MGAHRQDLRGRISEADAAEQDERAALVQAARDGDPAAAGVLWGRYRMRVLSGEEFARLAAERQAARAAARAAEQQRREEEAMRGEKVAGSRGGGQAAGGRGRRQQETPVRRPCAKGCGRILDPRGAGHHERACQGPAGREPRDEPPAAQVPVLRRADPPAPRPGLVGRDIEDVRAWLLGQVRDLETTLRVLDRYTQDRAGGAA